MDTASDATWKLLRNRFILRSLILTVPGALIGGYLVGLTLGMQGGETARALLLLLPVLGLHLGVQQFWVAGLLCRTAAAVNPADPPGARLERLLMLPRRLELLCLLPAYLLAGTNFTLICCLWFDRSLGRVAAGFGVGGLVALIVGIPTGLLFQEDLLPWVVQEQERTPKVRPKPGGLLWLRQAWYLPYTFAVFLLGIFLTLGILLSQKVGAEKDRMLERVAARGDAQLARELHAGVARLLGETVLAATLVALVLLALFMLSAWLMARREAQAARAIAASLQGLSQGEARLPQWAGSDELGDVSQAVASTASDMGSLFKQITAIAQGKLSLVLEGEGGLIELFKESQIKLLELADQMMLLSMGMPAGSTEFGDLGTAFGQLSSVMGGTIEQAKTIAAGDLRKDVKVSGELGYAIYQMTVNLRKMVGQTQEMGGQIGNIVVSLRAATAQLSGATSEQVSALTETSNTMTEMAQTSAASADRCVDLIRQGEAATAVVQEGSQGADEAGRAMTAISSSLGKVVTLSGALAEKVQQVDGIIETVSFLADQSSTLAINASIEASRAGDAGRSFGAVAREIRSLASDSRKATSQIRDILQEIRQKTVQVDAAAAAGTQTVQEGVQLFSVVGGVISQLGVVIRDAVSLMRQVEGSARQHQAGVGQVSQALRSMQAASESIRDGARSLNTLSETAHQLAAHLQTTAGSYQLPPQEEAQA